MGRRIFKRGIDPGCGRGQPLQIFSGIGRVSGNVAARRGHHIGDHPGRAGTRLMQALRELVEGRFLSGDVQHGARSRGWVQRRRHAEDGEDAIKKRDEVSGVVIGMP